MLLDGSHTHVRTPSHWRGERINDEATQPSTLCSAVVTDRDVEVGDVTRMTQDQVGEWNICPRCLVEAHNMVKRRRAR